MPWLVVALVAGGLWWWHRSASAAAASVAAQTVAPPKAGFTIPPGPAGTGLPPKNLPVTSGVVTFAIDPATPKGLAVSPILMGPTDVLLVRGYAPPAGATWVFSSDRLQDTSKPPPAPPPTVTPGPNAVAANISEALPPPGLPTVSTSFTVPAGVTSATLTAMLMGQATSGQLDAGMAPPIAIYKFPVTVGSMPTWVS